MKKQKILFPFILAIIMQVFVQETYAIEVASRISDREIIESLAELKAELKANRQVMEQRFNGVDQRFDAIDQRFGDMEKSIEQRFDGVNQRFDDVNQRFDGVNQRFDGVNQRLDTIEKNSNIRFGRIWDLMLIIIAGIFGLIGFIVWDRKTALRPLEKRLDSLEKDLQHDLELRHEKGSLLTRIVQALQELAKQDKKLAGVLKSFSLL